MIVNRIATIFPVHLRPPLDYLSRCIQSVYLIRFGHVCPYYSVFWPDSDFNSVSRPHTIRFSSPAGGAAPAIFRFRLRRLLLMLNSVLHLGLWLFVWHFVVTPKLLDSR